MPTVWASSAGGSYIRTVPVTTVDPNAASFTLGFPPNTMTAEGAGGVPPDGRDANGILNPVTAWLQWVQAGGAPVAYDSTFQAGVGGYPNGAVVASAATAGLYWRSVVDNNVTNPDTGGAGWVAFMPSLVVGEARGLNGSSAGGQTASWTVTELVAETSLGGVSFKGVNLTLSFNGATTGAGGMDTGSMPSNADLSVYAIYNPTTNAWSTLGCTGSTSNGPVYSGSHMPSGYAASALIYSGVTTGTNFPAFLQRKRRITVGPATVLSGGGASSWTAIALAAAVPANATTVDGSAIPNSGTGGVYEVACDSIGTGTQYVGNTYVVTGNPTGNFFGNFQNLCMASPQTIYYQTNTGGPLTVIITGYEF